MDSKTQLKSFFLLHFHTKILEACNWNESLASECIALLDYELSVAQRSGRKTAYSVIQHVAESMIEVHPESVVNAITEVLAEALQSAPFLIDVPGATKYEN